MSSRVTDDMVRRWLTWARNYGEIDGFAKIPNGPAGAGESAFAPASASTRWNPTSWTS